METKLSPGPGCERPQLRAGGPDPSVLRAEAPWLSVQGSGPRATPVTVWAPPQVPVGGGANKVSLAAKMASGLRKLWAPRAWQRGAAASVHACPWVRPRGRGTLPAACAGAGPEVELRCPHRPQPVGRGRRRAPSGSTVQTGGPGLPLPLSLPHLQGPSMGGGFAGLEFALPQEPQAADLGTPGTWAGAAGLPTPSVHIPVPAQRSPPGKAQLDEVMAAAALTSLSTSPLHLGAPAVAFSPEPCSEPWREAPVQPTGSYSSSSNSGDWGWDLASDQSSPSTPSPPLPPEAAHFLFGEPTPRKRKSPVQVVFQCLWKSCGKVLRTASAMQRHIRLVHLGRRRAEPEHSDGEEDFYYTELDIGVDTLTDGLSSLAPVSPEAPVPPAFPRLALPPVLSSAAPPQTCHSDHACQAGEATGDSWEQVSGHSGDERGLGCSSPQGCLAPVRVDLQPTEARAATPALPPKFGASLRKPRGDAKKCRKVYGMDHRDLWCTACRWKKACQRFLD